MDYFKTARENMIEGQLRPNGVTEEHILNAYRTVSREHFLPQNKKDVSYIDEDLILENETFLMEPVTHARMIKALNISSEEAVLDVACATGYSSAILSHISNTVVALSCDEKQKERAKKNCEDLDLYNIAFFSGELEDCCPKYAPYSAIIFNGAIPELPEDILNKLSNGGRVVYIERDFNAPIGSAKLLQKIAENKYSKVTLFDAATPFLPSINKTQNFEF